MAKCVNDQVQAVGFAFIPGTRRDLTSIRASARYGVPITLEWFATVQRLRPTEQSKATPNTYSGNYGLDEFPLHTDLAHWAIPPKYFALRCIRGSGRVRTRLVDGHRMVNDLGRDKLARALVQPRRPLGFCRALLRILDTRDNSGDFLRWDNLFITPATAQSATVFDEVGGYLRDVLSQEAVLSEPDDTLVIDNWRMLHGRTRVSLVDAFREIDRVYFDQLHVDESHTEM